MISRPWQTSPTCQQAERIAITGMGMISPVGNDVWGTAVALRKKRSSFFAHEEVLVADDRYGTVLRGATVSRVADERISRHLRGSSRAVALLSPAVRECIATLPSRLLRIPRWLIDNHLEPTDPGFLDRLQKALPDIPISGPWEKPPQDLSRCLFFERVIRAVERLQQGREQVALVGCVDSLVTVPRLEELLLARRLKDAVNPEGIMVGEAAGIILLERESSARLRNATIYGSIISCGRGTETTPSTGCRPCIGVGLTEAFREAVAPLVDAGAGVGAVIADLNGERHRAVEWAYTEGRIFPRSRRDLALRHPADTVGDCGGAMGAVIMVDAIAELIRHRTPRQVALYTSDDTGARRVICLEGGGYPNRRLFMDGIRTQLQRQKRAASKEEET